ncbi:Fanconi anemia group F protein [Hoplias malabaricus]|uniref:Fanconi anemia group F protein n=1 Tax=Hoplias malabaricus TaxID=27720 RepID=UPI003461F50B
MEAVVKNLSSTLELLAVSQTEFIREWDPQTMDRAFQWAKYCENVYSRFHANPSVRAVLEEAVRLTSQRLSESLPGYRPVSLTDVAQCRHRLFISLLTNPAAPYSVIESLFRLFEDSGDTTQGSETHLNLPGLIGCKSACKLLGSSPSLYPKETCGLAIGTQAQGLMLLQRINALQGRPGNETYTRTMLDRVLQDSGGLESVSEVVAASLLTEDSTCENTTAQDMLLDWLQGHHDLLHIMCHSLPVQLCTKLSQLWPKFRLFYWNVLKKWASSLEYDVNGGMWVPQCESAVTFKALVNHLKALWDSPLKEETKKELVVLKQADGDFDVRGLSVWTDLLLQL